MRLFWELTKLSFQRHISYRAATLAGLITNYFFGILRATIFVALYDIQSSVEGISIKGVITYAALGQVLISFLSIFQWYELMSTIYTGDVASDLLKPMNYFSFWLAKDLGRSAVQLIFRGLTLFFGFSLIYDLIWPASLLHLLVICISLILSWLISFSWRFVVNLCAFWTPDARGILRLAFVFSWFFSGFLMPLRFFPDWVIKTANLMPFPHMFNTVIEIYLGVLKGDALFLALIYQLLWAASLMFIGQIILKAGVRRLVIQGG
jgi:ABC-2 type transport system permease protein